MRMVFAFLAMILLLPVGAAAQTWSAEEQEIIDFTDSCWVTWSQEEVDRYLSDCWHQDITFWFSEHTVPFGSRWVGRAAPFWFSQNEWGAWDIQTHKVKVYGDAAVIQYQLLISSKLADGTIEHWAEGRSDFLVKENGAWTVVAVHTHPAPVSRN